MRSPGSLRPASRCDTATREIGQPVGQLLLGQAQLGPVRGDAAAQALPRFSELFAHVPTHLADGLRHAA